MFRCADDARKRIAQLFEAAKNRERLEPLVLMVPRGGIEPPLPKKPDFESGASTSSATPAIVWWAYSAGWSGSNGAQYIRGFRVPQRFHEICDPFSGVSI